MRFQFFTVQVDCSFLLRLLLPRRPHGIAVVQQNALALSADGFIEGGADAVRDHFHIFRGGVGNHHQVLAAAVLGEHVAGAEGDLNLVF